MRPLIPDIATVWQVVPDVASFRIVRVSSMDDQSIATLAFDGTVVEDWAGLSLYEDRVNLPRPDVYRVDGSTAVAFSDRAVDLLEEHCLLSSAGQLLPGEIDGVGQCWILNVLEVREYLDRDNTQWFAGMVETGLPERPVFHRERFGGGSIFKIAPRSWTFCWDDPRSGALGFRGEIERYELAGLVFHEVWNSREGGRRSPILPGGPGPTAGGRGPSQRL